MKLIKDAYYSWGAEVVFVTSNWQGNQEIMEGCKEEGIPAFVSNLHSIQNVSRDLPDDFAGNALGFLNGENRKKM